MGGQQTVRLDDRYRLYVPADDHDYLDPGTEYEVDVDEDGSITAKPADEVPAN